MGLLRLLLALSVIGTHAGPILGTRMLEGEIAVLCFFMISGFYMALILNEKYVGINDRPMLFWGNRLLRLFPVYLVVLGVIILALVTLGVMRGAPPAKILAFQEGVGSMPFLWQAYLVIVNFVMFGVESTYFFQSNGGQVSFTTDWLHAATPLSNFLLIPQSWSIGLELLFYICAPFLLRRSLPLQITFAVLSLLSRWACLTLWDLPHDPWAYRFFPNVLCFFIFGSLAYQIYRGFNKSSYLTGKAYLIPALFLSPFIVFYPFVTIPSRIMIMYALVFLAIPILFSHFKKSKADKFLGELSYPVYICHFFFIDLLLPFKTRLPEWSFGLVVSLISIGFSIVLVKLIDDPIDRLRQRRLQVHKL
ncbi:MAG: acyltransferase [Verrucomicrobiota bacterium]|nr:acyltransferase [Verrucomicrobiota bacterium]